MQFISRTFRRYFARNLINGMLVMVLGCLGFAMPAAFAVESPAKTSTIEQAVTKVNVNQASVEQLTQLVGVGEKKARAIIEYRTQHGNFQRIEDLLEVKGLGASFLEKNRERISL